MGIQLTQFCLYRYTCAGECGHELLVRVSRPSYPNYDQGAEDAAGAFADSAADHLRTWWERWLLPRDCRREHTAELIDLIERAISDELDGPGLREMPAWTAVVDDEPVIGVAPTEADFLSELNAYWGREAETRLVESHAVYFLTEQDGTGDLRDS